MSNYLEDDIFKMCHMLKSEKDLEIRYVPK